MALEKITFPLVVDGGINTKKEEMLVDIGQNLEVINSTFDKIGNLEKRNGTSKLAVDVDRILVNVPKTLSDIKPKFCLEHNEEIIIGGSPGENEIFSLSESGDVWKKKDGEPISPFVFNEDQFSNKYDIIYPHSVECPSHGVRYTGFVYTDNYAVNGIIVYKQDLETNNKTIEYQIEYIYTQTQVVAFKLNVLQTGLTPFLYISSATKTVSGSNYDVYVNGAHIDSNRKNIPYMDTVLVDDKLAIVYFRASVITPDTQLGISLVDKLNNHSDFTLNTSSKHLPSVGALTICYDNVNNLVFVGVGTDKGNPAIGGDNCVELFVYNKTLTLLGSNQYITHGSNGEVFRVLKLSSTTLRITPKIEAGGFVYFVVGVTYGKSFDNSKNITVFENDETFFYYVTFKPADNSMLAFEINSSRSCQFYGSIASKFFRINSSDDIYFIGQSTIIDDTSYFINRLSLSMFDNYPNLLPEIITLGSFSKISATFDILNTNTTLGRTYILPEVTKSDDNNFYYPAKEEIRSIPIANNISNASNILKVSGLILKRIEFESEYNGISAKLGKNTYLSGCTIKEYDGKDLLEQGFYQKPEFYVTGVLNNTYHQNGSRAFLAVFEYVDNNGQVHRSSPSTIKEATLSGAGYFEITITTPYKYIFGSKNSQDTQGNRTYSTVLYRNTLDTPQVFYRLGSYVANENVFYFSNTVFKDDVSDIDLEKAEIYYGNGGVLSNQQIGPVKHLISANNRIFALSSEDDNLLFYSKEHKYGESVNFSNLLTRRLDGGILNRSGVSKALASLDSKIIIFKDQSISYFVGQGPNELGEQNDFTENRLISSDIGLSDIKSIMTIPDGLVFKSNKGIYLLNRALIPEYIGFPVEKYNSEKINGVSNLVNEHKVIFITDNRTLVYDYLQKKWSVWGWKGDHLTTYKSLPIFIDQDKIYRQDKTIFKDDGITYSLKLVTPWLKLKGIQQYQRFYKLMILGKFKSAHDLIVKIYHDYDDSNVETHTIHPSNLDEIYQYDLSPIQQKGQSFKIELYDNNITGSGEGFSLSNLTLILGKKSGTNKTPDSRKY